uniref:Uncharacterized protein n=1 Tax=Anguilla anguilla TaxID=7936 RepID=A0A0E9U805_ANGAN
MFFFSFLFQRGLAVPRDRAVCPPASFLLILRRPSVLGALIRVCLLGLHLFCCHAN